MSSAARSSGNQFYRAIQQSIPVTRGLAGWMARLSGRALWAAFTLTGIPDRPVELGVVAADGNAHAA